MLTGRNVVFVGGDARQLEVIAQVTEMDGSATLIGYELADEVFVDAQKMPLTPEAFVNADAIVLPVAGMDDDGRVETQFGESPLYLKPEHFAATKKGCYVFSGIARPQLVAYCSEYELELVRLMELDEVAILNSIPTAEGAIAMAMEHTDITIHGAKTTVVGFGRCGKTLARTLAALGARVQVAARSSVDGARIAEMGYSYVPASQLGEALSDQDIVFNTAPGPVLDASVLAHARRTCVVIDIASRPGGTDFRYAERRGMTALLAPSLPGRVAPKTAGRIIGNTICRILGGDAD